MEHGLHGGSPRTAAPRAAGRARQPSRPLSGRSGLARRAALAAGRLAAGVAGFCVLLAAGEVARAAEVREADDVRRIVDEAVRPLIAAHDIAGMAVGVAVGGRVHVFNYGLASRETERPVDDATLFEIGSLSKTFTATLGGYAEAIGAMSLTDPAARRLPELDGAPLGEVPLRDLATYAAGDLPLQFPAGVETEDAMVAFFRGWRPHTPVGQSRRYSNPSIGLFGLAVASSLGSPFEDAMGRLLRQLGLTDAHLRVPPDRMDDYAFGYGKDGRPIRVNPGLLDQEAYGLKISAATLAGFLQANIDSGRLAPPLRRAIATAQSGYLVAGPMIQALGWERYRDPADLSALLKGAAPAMMFEASAAKRLAPPLPPQPDALYLKTGSTNGFGAVAAFAPARRVGVALLANRNYPIEARLSAVHRIVTALGAGGPPKP